MLEGGCGGTEDQDGPNGLGPAETSRWRCVGVWVRREGWEVVSVEVVLEA